MLTEVLWGVCLVVGVVTGNMLAGLFVMAVIVGVITVVKLIEGGL